MQSDRQFKEALDRWITKEEPGLDEDEGPYMLDQEEPTHCVECGVKLTAQDKEYTCQACTQQIEADKQ